MAAAVGRATVFTGGDTSEPVELAAAEGLAAMFSKRCPGVSGPNEDAAAVIPVDARRAVLIVADGLGGRRAGESASQIVVRAVNRHVGGIAGAQSLRTAILDALEEANRAIIESGTGAGSTAAVAEIEHDRVRGYHVGDSRILVVGQRGRVKFRTLCHAPTAYAVESGLLDESDALHHEDRHLVSNIIGDAGMRIEISSWLALADRDTALLATDGVFDNLHAHEVVKAICTGTLAQASGRLAEASLRRMRRPAGRAPSKPDDMTFILYRAQAGAASSNALRTCA